MLRGSFRSLCAALSRRPVAAAADRGIGVLHVSCAGIRYSRIKPDFDATSLTADSKSALPPAASSRTVAPSSTPRNNAAETSAADASGTWTYDEDKKGWLLKRASGTEVAAPPITPQEKVEFARCSLGIIRNKRWDAMESEARYHWRSLGWGPHNWDSGPSPNSESKEWSELNAVERHSAVWLGYNEQRWKDDDPDKGENFQIFCFAFAWFFFLILTAKSENERVEGNVPMSPSKRRLLKIFIMKKEREALISSDESGTEEILETGAVDCLYGLHTLYQKLLTGERELGSESMDDLDSIETVSAAGWQHAVRNPCKQVIGDTSKIDTEEAAIAQMLFEAADLDKMHSISFTEFAMLAVLLSATDARDADAQVELLCNMVTADERSDSVDKDAARSFVLTCLRSGVRLDLKPLKSASGLVAHGILDGLPVDLKESGLAQDSGMIVLRQRHKGLTWKAADAIVDPLFKLLDPDAKGCISSSKFKEFFLHRLHPDLQRHAHAAHSSGSALRVHHGTGTSNQHSTWDFNRVVQGARQKYQQRQAARSSGCFIAGTEVLTPSGSQVSIERLRLGDAVMAFDCEGMLQPASVRGCMSFLSDKHYVVTLSNGSVMRVTGQHPICVAPDTFCRADALLVGHRVMVRTSECDSLVDAAVTRVEAVSGSTVVYNLSTTPHRTFFAADAAVHNKGGCFVAGTEVLTPSGSQVSIERLRLGDAVMAFDCEGMLQPASVRGCMSFLSDKHYVVTLSNGSVMRVTGQHPICVAPDTFCRADALLVGHRVMVRTSECDSLVDAAVTRVEAVSDSTVVYNLSTTPHHTFFAADAAVHNKGGGCFSGIVPVTVILKNSDRRRVCMSQLRPGDVIEGGGLVTAVMSFLRSEAAPLYQYQGTIVTADHAVKTPEGWKRVRDTDARLLSEEEVAAQGDVLFDIITETHEFSTADGVVFADYEELDAATPEDYLRLTRELNYRDFGGALP